MDASASGIYTLSLHDALPIFIGDRRQGLVEPVWGECGSDALLDAVQDRKSTRLNSSHGYNSYAVFCWKKKTVRKIKQSSVPTPSLGSRWPWRGQPQRRINCRF